MPTLMAILDAQHVVPSPADDHGSPGVVFYCGSFEEGSPVHIGRTANPGLHIPDWRVSELHAVIHRAGETYLLRDRGSKNGTHVLIHGALWQLDFDPSTPALSQEHALQNEEQFFVSDVPVFFFHADMTDVQVRDRAEHRRGLGIRDARSYPRMQRRGKGGTAT